MDFVESGTLPIGVCHEGELYTGFSLRPMTVRAGMAVRKSPDIDACKGDDELMGLLSFAARLEIPGIPKEAMTLDFMLDLYDDDLDEVLAADGRLKEQIAQFRGQGPKTVDPGTAGTGDSVGSGKGDAGSRGPGVAGRVDRPEEPEEETEEAENTAEE